MVEPLSWLVEEGIGETRAILLDGGEIRAACVEWPGKLAAGLIDEATLISRIAGTPRGTARFANGQTALVDRLPREASEGGAVRLEVTRAALSEARRSKLAQARPTDATPRRAPTLAERLPDARTVHHFPDCDWDELVSEALSGEFAFTGGTLHFAPTPAMLLIDIDGTGSPRDLALAAVPALAASLRRFDCSGSIGVDFPTLPAKADRRAVDDALTLALAHPQADWPHERTAMNGFGFVQLVARMQRPSLLDLAQHHRPAMAARLLLRRAEHLAGAGRIQLTAHPAVLAYITESWQAELRRRTGRQLTITADPNLALEAPQAQIVPL